MITKNYVAAVAILISSIVGVGMFTLPYIGSKAGLLTLIGYFIVLGFFQHWFHTVYANVVLSTKQQHRLPGYAEKYFGIKSKKYIFILSMFGGYGALLAYTIIGGEFLYHLVNPYLGGSLFQYTVGLLAFRALIIYFGLAWVTRVEVILTGGLVGSLLIIAALAGGQASISNLTFFNSSNILLAYGPVLFAVGGALAINDICILLNKEKQRIVSALRVGIISAIAIMIFFTVVVTSISGSATSPDALGGLGSFIDPLYYTILLIIGLVTVTTSFFIVAESIQEMYIWDYKINKHLAWLIVVLIPLALYALGARDVTKVIALTGAISGGLLGGFYIFLGLRVKAKPEKKPPFKVFLNPLIAYGVTILLLIGMAYQLWEIFG